MDYTWLGGFTNRQVVILGDVILDKFSTVQDERPSSEHEGRNLVVTDKTRMHPGGAGNTALNIVSLGGSAQLVSVVGIGGSSRELQELLRDLGIDTTGLIYDQSRQTSCKQRFVFPDGRYATDVINWESVDGQGRYQPITAATEHRAIEQLRAFPGRTVVISDYHRGFITPGLLQQTVELCHSEGRRLIYDIRPRTEEFDFSGMTGAFLITPNRCEAQQLLGRKEPITNGQDSEEACRQLAARFNTNVLLTRDGQGMTLYERDRDRVVSFPAYSDEQVVCVSGAGDTVVATTALAIEMGAPLCEAVEMAAHAAAISISKPGTATVEIDELRRSVEKSTLCQGQGCQTQDCQRHPQRQA